MTDPKCAIQYSCLVISTQAPAKEQVPKCSRKSKILDNMGPTGIYVHLLFIGSDYGTGAYLSEATVVHIYSFLINKEGIF